jgi:alginate O-acetyltransferase complex protein AlgI
LTEFEKRAVYCAKEFFTVLFSGIPFLYYFLPVTILLYAAAPRVCKNAVLALCSLVFYAWGEPRLVVLMLLTVFLKDFSGLTKAILKKLTEQGHTQNHPKDCSG